jgi:hypothetical protein
MYRSEKVLNIAVFDDLAPTELIRGLASTEHPTLLSFRGLSLGTRDLIKPFALFRLTAS